MKVSETRELGEGETEESVTHAIALDDAMFEVMDELGEIDEDTASVKDLKRQIAALIP